MRPAGPPNRERIAPSVLSTSASSSAARRETEEAEVPSAAAEVLSAAPRAPRASSSVSPSRRSTSMAVLPSVATPPAAARPPPAAPSELEWLTTHASDSYASVAAAQAFTAESSLGAPSSASPGLAKETCGVKRQWATMHASRCSCHSLRACVPSESASCRSSSALAVGARRRSACAVSETAQWSVLPHWAVSSHELLPKRPFLKRCCAGTDSHHSASAREHSACARRAHSRPAASFSSISSAEMAVASATVGAAAAQSTPGEAMANPEGMAHSSARSDGDTAASAGGSRCDKLPRPSLHSGAGMSLWSTTRSSRHASLSSLTCAGFRVPRCVPSAARANGGACHHRYSSRSLRSNGCVKQAGRRSSPLRATRVSASEAPRRAAAERPKSRSTALLHPKRCSQQSWSRSSSP